MTEEARNHRELLSLCCSRPQTQGLQDKDCSGSQMQQVRYRKVVIQVMVFLVASICYGSAAENGRAAREVALIRAVAGEVESEERAKGR